MREDAHHGFHDEVDQISSRDHYYSENILKIYVSFELARENTPWNSVVHPPALDTDLFSCLSFFSFFSHCGFSSKNRVASLSQLGFNQHG